MVKISTSVKKAWDHKTGEPLFNPTEHFTFSELQNIRVGLYELHKNG